MARRRWATCWAWASTPRRPPSTARRSTTTSASRPAFVLRRNPWPTERRRLILSSLARFPPHTHETRFFSPSQFSWSPLPGASPAPPHPGAQHMMLRGNSPSVPSAAAAAAAVAGMPALFSGAHQRAGSASSSPMVEGHTPGAAGLSVRWVNGCIGWLVALSVYRNRCLTQSVSAFSQIPAAACASASTARSSTSTRRPPRTGRPAASGSRSTPRRSGERLCAVPYVCVCSIYIQLTTQPLPFSKTHVAPRGPAAG